MAMAYPGVLDCLEPPTHTKKKKGEQKEEEINGYKLHQIWFHPETTQPLSKWQNESHIIASTGC